MRAFVVAATVSVFGGAALVAAFLSARTHPSDRVSVKVDEQDRRVDISIDGEAFTSYIWPAKLAKPVLYPLRTAKGTIVTRGYPLEPLPGERVDHPHHAGMWLNYENVNGIDFWNNSEAIKPQDAPKMGTIQQRAILSAKGGTDQGELEVEADWLTYDKRVLLKEHTRYVFRGGPNFRHVDRITTLQAQGETIVFADAKDGMLGLRVVRALEAPSDKAEAAWGTRGRWCNLSGKVGEEPVTISIFDHPSNPGFPTYWHARGYGLFAANPLGEKIFSNGKEELSLTLAPRQSVTFRYKVLISSEILTPESTEAAYKGFVAAYH
jgi:hypothetical protein